MSTYVPNPTVNKEVLIRQIAAAALTGATVKDIAAQLGMTVYYVRRIMGTDGYKEVMRELGDEATHQAKQIIRAETGKLAKEVMRVLQAKLQEDNLEAVKIALKVLGLDQLEDKQLGDTNISVVLPGATPNQPTTIDAEVSDAIIVQDGSNREGME